VQQQGGTDEFERNEAAMALAILSIYEDEFLHNLRTNLESTLWRYGFALSPREMEIVRDTFGEHSDLSDEDFIEVLRQGIVERVRHWPW
jgi:hypothetical protein